MTIVQVSLDQVLSALKGSLHSIDLRAAVVHADKLHSLVTGVRISARSVSAAKDRQIKLINDLGQGEAGSFKVLYDALAFSHLNDVLQELEQGRLTVGGHQIHFPGAICGDSLRGYIRRDPHFVRPWDTRPAPAFYSYLKFSQPGLQSDLLSADVRRSFGVRSVNNTVDAFLEVNYSGQEAVNFFTHVEMPARIIDVSLSGCAIRVDIEAENHFGELRLCVNRYDSSGMKLLQSRFPDFRMFSDEDARCLYSAETTFDSVRESDIIDCVLTHNQLPELDEVSSVARNLMRAEERNPLLESFRKFWNVNKLYEQAVKPFLTKPRKVDAGPQDVFQKSIARLLNLAGFQAIDLGREDKIYHPDTKIERATVDILGYHPLEKILLLGACTIGVPKTDDYEKLLHAREIFKESLTPEIPLYIAPVLFTMQENVSPFRTDMATVGLRVLNTRDLDVLTKLIDKGQEVKFINFLKSQLPATLE